MPLTQSKILIVDDDLDACTSLRRILRLDGYETDLAHSIEEMLRPRQWSDYLAIILDRRLPDGTVDDRLPDIKQRAARAAIIVVTGYADLESSITALRSGAEDYLLKPVNPDVLRATIARFAKLREAETRAAQAERLAGIGKMMSAIAHESRNSLQRIQSGIDMLELEFGNEALAMQEVAKIQRGADELRSLLEEIREFAAPVNLDRAACDMPRIWRRAWHNVMSVRDSDSARLDEQIATDQTSCSGDSFRLEQVFRNLFENSLAACAGDAQIRVQCADAVISGQDALQIHVRDNGTGFTNGDAKRVFEPFFSTKTDGTGLGMAIVKRIIEAHGGAVRVGENQNPGAEIVIMLPKC